MNIDMEAFKALAESANAVTGDVRVDVAITSDAGPNQAEIDAVTAFMGMATPATILALLAQIDLLNAENQCRVRQVERLVDEAESLRQNAYRYLVLRQADVDTIQNGGLFAGLTPDNLVINGEDLDRRTDAVIEEQRALANDLLGEAAKAGQPSPGAFALEAFAWIYARPGTLDVKIYRARQHYPNNWVANGGYTITPLYTGPVNGEPAGWAYRVKLGTRPVSWRVSLVEPCYAGDPGDIEVMPLYKGEPVAVEVAQ